MYQGKLPFDDVPVQAMSTKSIPRGHEAFVEYIEYLATSPQIDASFVSDHITQFLKLPKAKDDHKQRVFFAMSNLELPDDFWATLFSNFKSQVSKDWKFAAEFLTALSAAPVSAILQEFNSLNFVNQFLDSTNLEIRFAAMSVMYKFRDNINVTEEIIQKMLANLTEKSPKIVFLTINWIMFLISIDFPDFEDIIKPYRDQIFDVLIVLGHLINQKQVEFILNHTQPTIPQRLSVVLHSSISTSCYILTSLPLAKDFTPFTTPLNVVLPLYIDIIKNPFSNGSRFELFMAALKTIVAAGAPMADKPFFETISTMLLNEKGNTDFKLVALFAKVAKMYGMLNDILDRSSQAGVNDNYFSKLVAVSCIMGIKEDMNIMRDIMKLFTWPKKDSSWYVATGAAFQYLMDCNVYTIDKFQELTNISSSITDDRVRAMLLIFLSYFAPINFKTNLVKEMKTLLFPHLFVKYPDVINFKDMKIHDRIPLLIRVAMARCIGALAQPDELEDIQEELKAPLLNALVKIGPLTGESTLVDPFFLSDVKDIGHLSAAITNVDKIMPFCASREFHRISPTCHALNVEVATSISPMNKSIAMDVRISVQMLTPQLKVSFEVPPTFTPHQMSPWVITNLNAGQKVNHTVTITANKITNPYIGIRIEQEGQDILYSKLCVPVIDMFATIDQQDLVAKHIWGKLSHEEKVEGMADGMWASVYGVVGIKNGVARADNPKFFKMLPSANETVAIIG